MPWPEHLEERGVDPTYKGGTLPIRDRVEPTTSSTQTDSELELVNRIHPSEAAYLCLSKPLDPDDEDRLRLQHMLRLFCPKIEDSRLPAMVDPAMVLSKGYGENVTFWQLTRELEGTERHEMTSFFIRFEKYLMISRVDGDAPTYEEAWEALRRLLWGLAATLYKHLDQDYDDSEVLFAQAGSKYEPFRWLMTNGAAVYRRSTTAWNESDLCGGWGAQDLGAHAYHALVEYDFDEETPDRAR